MSAELAGLYPDLPAGLTEQAMFDAHQMPVVRESECVCGAVLVQRAGERPEDVHREHIGTARHVAWRIERGDEW